MKKKLVVLVCIALTLLICVPGCKSGNELFLVNGEPILEEDYDRIQDTYGYTSEEIFEGLILETLVLQYGTKCNISVSNDAIEDAVQTVKGMGKIYEKAIDTYGSLEKYKDALVNRYLYEEVKQDVISEYARTLVFSDRVVDEGVVRFLEENNYNINEISDDEILKIKASLKENFGDLLSDIYFNSWNYDLLKEASIKYINVDDSSLFQRRRFDKERGVVIIDNNYYPLKETTVNDANKRFGSIINFYSTGLNSMYKYTNLKESTRSLYSIKVLEMTLANERNGDCVSCDIIINPLYYEKDSDNNKNAVRINGHYLIKDDENNEYYIYDDKLCVVYRFFDINMNEISLMGLINNLMKYGYVE